MCSANLNTPASWISSQRVQSLPSGGDRDRELSRCYIARDFLNLTGIMIVAPSCVSSHTLT